MDSQLKPCPHCGGNKCSARIDFLNGGFYVGCPDCGMRGPNLSVKVLAIIAWNDIPRNLKWTSEPPTQPGWYFTRRNSPGYPVRVTYVKQEERYSRKLKKDAMYFTMAQTEDDDGYVIDDLNQNDRQWAGPITNPKDAK